MTAKGGRRRASGKKKGRRVSAGLSLREETPGVGVATCRGMPHRNNVMHRSRTVKVVPVAPGAEALLRLVPTARWTGGETAFTSMDQ